jgi:tRNA threonylcarbamoyladenosine biosynthesis protein TsaE
MEQMEIRTENELETVARKVIEQLTLKKREESAAVLALHGELGAGKTAFVKALARMLGAQEDVTSPTFVILKLYALQEDGVPPFSQLAHIDAYRIDDTDEMRVLRFEELLTQKNTLICIEWAERIQELLPSHTVHMSIQIKGEGRTITLS